MVNWRLFRKVSIIKPSMSTGHHPVLAGFGIRQEYINSKRDTKLRIRFLSIRLDSLQPIYTKMHKALYGRLKAIQEHTGSKMEWLLPISKKTVFRKPWGYGKFSQTSRGICGLLPKAADWCNIRMSTS